MNIVNNIECKENYLDAIIVDMNNINENFSKQLLFSLKPGGHIITINDKVKYHRNTIALEDMGFEIRDQIIYFFGNDSKSLCLGRKPLTEKTIVDNVIKWGTGGINVDGCRIGFKDESDKESAKPGSLNATGENSMFGLKSGNEQNDEGRFPANILFDETAAELLDEQSGISKSTKYIAKDTGYVSGSFTDDNKRGFGYDVNGGFSDKGGASRFFYITKTSNDLIDYLTKLITPENGTILIYSK
jgi:site-specific DNA-methyltransferase (adenine-specific)